MLWYAGMIKRAAWCGIWVIAYWLISANWLLLRSQQPANGTNTPRRINPAGLPLNPGNKALQKLADSTTPTLSVTSLSTFVYQIGGTAPPDQTISVTSSGNQVNFSAARFNYGWINVNPSNAVTPAQIDIGVNPAGMPANTYDGVVTIESSDIANGPLSVPVVLVIVAAGQRLLPDLVVTSFSAPATGAVGASISGASATVANSGTAPAPAFQLEYFLSPNPNVTSSDMDTGSGCAVPGLAVGATFTCAVNIGIPSNISPGVYYLAALADPGGVVTESDRSNNSKDSSGGPITLAAAPANEPQLVVTSFLAPTHGVAGGMLSGVSVVVLNSGTADAGSFRLEYYVSQNAAVTTSDIDTGWGCDVPGLPMNSGFECGGAIGLPGSLAPGTYYIAAIADSAHTISQPSRTPDGRDSDNGPIVVTSPVVTAIASNGIVDPFTYTNGLAPGAWVTIYGSSLASMTQSWSPAPDRPIATTLGGVTVTVNGVAAPISYVSPGQVNILVPSNAGEGPASVVVANLKGAAGYSLLSTQYLPAVYCNPAAGATPARFYVTAVDPVTGEFVGNASIDSRVSAAARPGETVDIYGTGLGPPAGNVFPTGTLFSTAYPIPLNFAVVFGGTRIVPQYAALVGPGLYQVRFTIPGSAGNGDVPVYLDFGSAQSAQNVYLTIGQ